MLRIQESIKNSPRTKGGADIEVIAIVFLMYGQKYYGVSIDSAENLSYNCYEDKSEFYKTDYSKQLNVFL